MGFFSSKGDREKSVADELPWLDLTREGYVILKDGAVMKVWRTVWPDSLLNEDESDWIAEKMAKFYQRHTEDRAEKVAYWFVEMRTPISIGVPPEASGLINMDSADSEIENHRESILMQRSATNLNLSYAAMRAPVQFGDEGITPDSLKRAEILFGKFETAVRGIRGARIKALTTSNSVDKEDNIICFLKHMQTLEPEIRRYRCPESGMLNVDVFLSGDELVHGKPLRLGDRYIQPMTIRDFPDATHANCLSPLLELPFCYTWVTRWVPFSNWDSQQKAKSLRKNYRAGAKSWKTVLYETSTGNQSEARETQAVVDAEEMDDVLVSIAKNGETIGELTSTILVPSDDPSILPSMVQDLKKVFSMCGFEAIEEDKWSSFHAWKGALPGNLDSNYRRPYVTASNLSDIIPFASVYHGESVNRHMRDITGLGYPHAIGKLRTNELYYLNLNGSEDDVGHTFIIGSTGSGKSVLLAFLASQWMRYPNSRVILFDKDFSFKNLTERSGGAVYVPGAEDSKLKFMPLSNIKRDPSEAVRWVETVVAASNLQVTPEISKGVQELCETWDDSTPPTVDAFYRRLQSIDPNNIALEALQRLHGNPRLMSLFSGDRDELGPEAFKRKTMFEMGPLMNMGDEAVLPALQFLFDRLDALFDAKPAPTLLILDEAWKFLRHPVFRSRISEWLKTLRKKRVFVIMAVQNLGDLDDVEEFITSCHTRIFLPNTAVDRIRGTDEIRRLYSSIGCTESEMDLIAIGDRKSEYFIKQEEGSALVSFQIDPYQLKRLSRDGT